MHQPGLKSTAAANYHKQRKSLDRMRCTARVDASLFNRSTIEVYFKHRTGLKNYNKIL